MTRGIAHVSFKGGGACLPARTPYDRQIVIEHVLDRVRVKGLVQVLLNGQRWLVQRTDPVSDRDCGNCGRRRQALCIAPAKNEPALCPGCALGGFETAPFRNGDQAAVA